MAPLKRILVPVDFSECSRHALRRADELARVFDARLDVLHVWQTPAFVVPEAFVGRVPNGQNVVEHALQHAEKSFQSLLVLSM
jgi:nucleotide-binding universal stress UspA family protein